MSAVRSVVAVLAGFLAVGALSVGADAVMHEVGIFPPVPVRMADAMFIWPAVYRAAFTVLGGWITARLAPSRPMGHAVVLAVLGTLGGLAGLVGTWGMDLGPTWYAVSIPLSAFPCILAGAWLAGVRAPGTPPSARPA